MKTCVFAGTFDPITIGHEYVIKTCQKMFDKVVVAVGKNKDKTPFFTLEERLEVLKETFKDSNIEIKYFDGYLVDFMKENGYTYFARGVRDETDFLYECEMARFNEGHYDKIVTFFIPTLDELKSVSSSKIKELMLNGKDYTKFVPTASVELMTQILNKRR